MTETEYRTFPDSVRQKILQRDAYRCQICGRVGPSRGGDIDLEAHHMEENPNHIDRNHPANGTTMCVACHHLITHRVTADDLPFDIDSIVARHNLLYKDIEILLFLYEHGPAGTSAICEATSSGTRPSIIERLWTLMSIETDDSHQSTTLIDKDRDSGKWGFPDQIQQSIRSSIPADQEESINLLRDELLRRLLEAGVNRGIVAKFVGRSERGTFYIEKRAAALAPSNSPATDHPLLNGEELDMVVSQLAPLLKRVNDPQQHVLEAN